MRIKEAELFHAVEARHLEIADDALFRRSRDEIPS
jgi:hypothetical protein